MSISTAPARAAASTSTGGRRSIRPLVGALVLVVVIGVPFGLAVGALAPRELEAVLVMVGVVGVQLSLVGTELVAKLLPFWGPHGLHNLATGDRVVTLESALAGVAYGLGLLLAAALLMAQRLRIEAPVQGGAAHIPPRASRTASFSTEEGTERA